MSSAKVIHEIKNSNYIYFIGKFIAVVSDYSVGTV
jgi:hypothetical protein